MEVENRDWTALSYTEKNHQLYLRQKTMLDSFLEHGAISQAQHGKSIRDLSEKMGRANESSPLDAADTPVPR